MSFHRGRRAKKFSFGSTAVVKHPNGFAGNDPIHDSPSRPMREFIWAGAMPTIIAICACVVTVHTVLSCRLFIVRTPVTLDREHDQIS